MKAYKCKSIRNIALTGHGGCGKTTLVDALVYKSGGSDRMGKVSEGTSLTDYDPDEIKRKVSLNTALAYAVWKDVKINLVDTPGQFDFVGGMYEGIRAAESVLIALTAKDGVQVGTIKAFREADAQKKAKILVVTRTEEENSNFYKVLDDARDTLGASVCPVIIPLEKGGKIESYVNLLTMKAYTYDKNGNATESGSPSSEARVKELRSSMAEAIAGTDEELMMRYFENEGEDFSESEMIKGLHDGIANGSITPVVCCNADPLSAIDLLLDVLVNVMPCPDELVSDIIEDTAVQVDETKPMSAFVFKTIADPFVGKMSFVRIITGALTAKTEPVNATTGEVERFGKMLALKGKKQDEITEAFAGDIVAITKLSANTNDTLCQPGNIVKYNSMTFPVPCFFQAVAAKGKGDEGKISTGIQRILEEDLTINYENNRETHQRVLGGLGEQHLSVVVQKLKNKFGVDVELSDPIIAYREAIRKKVVGIEGLHKKQSGGSGQYGKVVMEFEPHEGDELIFEERVFGGSVPKNFFPAVDKGLQESVAHGVLAGYPVVRLKATLVDGKYHPVDSSEIAFKLAAHVAFKAGVKAASPCLLEPIVSLKILVNDDATGDIMGVLNKRRGAVLGTTPIGGGMSEILAEMPQSETTDFSTVVRQSTRGMGSFTMEFARYEQLPGQLEADVIANAPKFSEYEG
ncbi:MAG: elongation factor G [Eubacterium sp.]|nr:elongation factor G [Eubacterium sp.]